ncbi:hypothetical protein OC844_002532 [Tilletia horrida]|nr:hypothetical protein OC844_002532 [Tilletia horrida]
MPSTAPALPQANTRTLFKDGAAQNAWMDGVSYGCWTPDQVLHMLRTEAASVFVLDVRAVDNAETASDAQERRKFTGAHRHPPFGGMNHEQGVENVLEYLELVTPQQWTQLLAAKYVVVHCQMGQERSPAMMRALNKRLAQADVKAKRTPKQVVGLMIPGFQGLVGRKDLATQLAACSVPLTAQDAQAFASGKQIAALKPFIEPKTKPLGNPTAPQGASKGIKF